VIDLHSHILPGVDDGAATLDESLEIARALADAGVVKLAATPHVRADYPTTPDMMEERLASVRERLSADAVQLDVLPGAEVAFDVLPDLEPEELARFGLGGNPSLLLLEFPYSGWPGQLASALADLRGAGFRVVLGHPERNDEVQAAPATLWPLVEAGAFVQLTAASVVGAFGSGARDAAHALLDLELAHLVATDAHSADRRIAIGNELVSALASDVPLARWLTSEVPAALLASQALPPRPPRERRRLWRASRFRW